ncbi:helix-turn-helix domain-containing protein [Abyssibius alkaniclasticus]|uniref:helix-turn-helix domain-containing protein n=1 Tax=Abyssibius alkaniclasticus TaxID=2881234 RepID=UPI0040580E42
MQITAQQCRAGRSLLGWSQDELAKNAIVSRATIADFESNARQPTKNNLRSIADSMFAAGVELVPEEGSKGVGVRFFERKVEYIKNVRIDEFNRNAKIKMRFGGEEFVCVFSLNLVDDHHRSNFADQTEYASAIERMLHLILAAAERSAATNIVDGVLLITGDMIEEI